MTQLPSQELCGCGCGEPAGVYATSNSAAGIVAGTPKRFVHGHHNRLSRYQTQAQPFETCYTVQPNGCWRWNVVHDGDSGYGRYEVDGYRVGAHRVAWTRAHGPIPDDVRVDHLCHDPATCPGGVTCPHRACVNPAHLQITSHATNCRRGVLAKLTAEQAQDIRRRRAQGETGVALAQEYGVRPTTISMIFRGRTWK